MNIDDIARKISKKSFLTINESKIVVNRILKIMKESLKNNNRIELRGFGTFYTKKRKGKVIDLPTKRIVSKEHYGVLFKNSNIMLEQISKRKENENKRV